MRLGIDFGTTNSAVAFFDDDRLIAVQMSPGYENDDVLPSLIYIDREFNALSGMPAAEAYLERETGRPVRWQKKSLGILEMLVAGTGGSPILVHEEMFVMVDTAANGRLIQSIKTALRDPNYEGTYIFDRFYTLDQLIALVLGRLKQGAEAQFGKPCDEIILGRPVKFSDDPEIDARAEEILYKAARLAGFEKACFEREPVGVMYLYHISSAARQTGLIFDFGGGTLDLTIARLGGAKPPRILASRGVLVGGDDLDSRIMGALLKYFGQGTTVGGYPFPHDMLDLLRNWQTMPELSRPQHMGRINDFKRNSSNPSAVYALETLVTRNVGYKLFAEIERVKRALSASIIAKLDFRYGAIRIHEVITRVQFERMIETEVEKVRAGIYEVLAAAEMEPSALDVVLRTGGTSLVPVFINMLEEIFGAGKVQDVEPLVSVVGGLAVAAGTVANQYRESPYAIRYDKASRPVITNIRTAGGSVYEPYTLRIGETAYVNSQLVITRCPVMLSGLPAIRTAGADQDEQGDEFLRFDIQHPARIYVAYQSAARELPTWLQSFTPEALTIEIKGEWVEETYMQLYSKDFPAGTVTLGGCRANEHAPNFLNYIVIVRANP
ncbi:MAG: Hsp70 family protein [Anaerolineae bacterium]|nr:Hsp70 family protein [Anaerolineae bacterium]